MFWQIIDGTKIISGPLIAWHRLAAELIIDRLRNEQHHLLVSLHGAKQGIKEKTNKHKQDVHLRKKD